MTQRQVEMILDQIKGEYQESARELIALFSTDRQVGIAEMLLDAQRAGRYSQTEIRLRELPPDKRTLGNIIKVDESLGLMSAFNNRIYRR